MSAGTSACALIIFKPPASVGNGQLEAAVARSAACVRRAAPVATWDLHRDLSPLSGRRNLPSLTSSSHRSLNAEGRTAWMEVGIPCSWKIKIIKLQMDWFAESWVPRHSVTSHSFVVVSCCDESQRRAGLGRSVMAGMILSQVLHTRLSVPQQRPGDCRCSYSYCNLPD